MQSVQAKRKSENNWEFLTEQKKLKAPLVLVFGCRLLFENCNIHEEVSALFPDGHIVYGSTAGEIIGPDVYDQSITLTAIEFEKSSFSIACDNILAHNQDISALGKALVSTLPKEHLKHILLISDGSLLNGSELINAIETNIDTSVGLSGGLCGDDSRFEKTLSSYNEAPKSGEVIAIGFYGETLEITAANYGGWNAFGSERTVTKSHKNVLCEIDGKPALELYKMYLGDKAKDLPEAALLFPLKVWANKNEQPIVRTILNIDNDKQCMILAGDVPQGSKVQLMMATVDDIVEGAAEAADLASKGRKNPADLAILVSCIGRKLVMHQRTEEEIEEVIYKIGEQSVVTGFYSYGEIAPFPGEHTCQLHNQTMTLTLFSE